MQFCHYRTTFLTLNLQFAYFVWSKMSVKGIIMFLGMNNTRLEREILIILDFENGFLPTYLPQCIAYASQPVPVQMDAGRLLQLFENLFQEFVEQYIVYSLCISNLSSLSLLFCEMFSGCQKWVDITARGPGQRTNRGYRLTLFSICVSGIGRAWQLAKRSCIEVSCCQARRHRQVPQRTRLRVNSLCRSAGQNAHLP